MSMKKFLNLPKNGSSSTSTLQNKESKKQDEIVPTLKKEPKYSVPNTYLGQKGYTLLKTHMNQEQLEWIKKELTIKPCVNSNAFSGITNNTVSFPSYRESQSKIYVPRYFGEEHFGPPKDYKVSEGLDIDVPFAGELRDYQKPAVDAYLKHVSNVVGELGGELGGEVGVGTGTGGGGGLFDLYCAFGKTSISLYIAAALKKKTLVIVHKEFLMNQWIERIQQFLPTARVGKIQGQIIDIENKDIVLGMLQSLSMKDYPPNTFDSFGFTIIDEVHHISSEVFSCALFKLVTKYMLGLSATMERKDGTTKVFKMFLGQIVYKAEREEKHSVVVRAIDYLSNDDEFKEVVTDFRGNVQYSTMITKLCCYSHRSEFILVVLKGLLLEEDAEKKQIMIIAHNKNLLNYLYEAIKTREIASVGYYIGGMKEAALKESETKKVIIATYSMAAEALDIKTLNTLIMATPKTDIEQAVGRILREKHGSPVVIDIIDEHMTFRNQWSKRKSFYKKQNYKIIRTKSVGYNPEVNSWKVEREEMDPIVNKCTDLQGKCFLKSFIKK